jgi:predicted RNase H-like HicB family nuclease
MMTIELDREEDGRWIAEVIDLPGVIVYGGTRDEAISNAIALSLRVLADRVQAGEPVPELDTWFATAA